jgi:nucleotide-binding universal stress UspA family protein
MRRILVGYDGTDGGRRALERAVSEARAVGGRVTVLSVVNVPLDPDVPRYFGTLDDISSREGTALSPPPDVVAHLTEARELLAKAGIDADLEWAAGEPGSVIVETARRNKAHVIVLGEHHHGFLGRLFGADIDAEVQREAGCDVILA